MHVATSSSVCHADLNISGTNVKTRDDRFVRGAVVMKLITKGASSVASSVRAFALPRPDKSSRTAYNAAFTLTLQGRLDMYLEIHKPELVQRVNAHIRTGKFHDADELIEKALDALEEKTPAPAFQNGLVSATLGPLNRRKNPDRL